MKLRNKKTGGIGICELRIVHSSEEAPLFYHSLAEVNRDWEDYKPVEPLINEENSKYYLINEETRYIATFDSEREMKIFQNEIDGWKPVKVLLDD